MDPCLLGRHLKIICEKERGAWWKHGQCGHTRGERAPSALVCVSLASPFFLAPINNFRRLLPTGYTDPKLHWPCWILWLGLRSDMPLLISVRQTLSSLWQGECLMSQQFYQTWSCVLLMLFCDRFCLSFQWESCSIFKVIEQGLHLSQNQGISFAVMKNVTSISLWLNQEYNFILTQWILACLAGAWK